MPQLKPHIRLFICAILIIPVLLLLVFYIQPKFAGPLKKKLAEKTLTGIVIEYRPNRIGDIDKLLITTSAMKCWVHFPPHLAKMVMATLPAHELAEIMIVDNHKKYADDLAIYEFISARSASSTFEADSKPPPKPATGNKIELSGRPARYIRDDKGMVSGIVIDNYLVDLSPRIIQNLMPVIQTSLEVVVKGYERNADQGFVNTYGLIVIKPYAIAIDKTDYLL